MKYLIVSFAFLAAFCSTAIYGRPDDTSTLQKILSQAMATPPGEKLEELAELSSRYVTREPEVFLKAQSDSRQCFGVRYLGAKYVDNPIARARELSARRKALESVKDSDLAAAKSRCLTELAGS